VPLIATFYTDLDDLCRTDLTMNVRARFTKLALTMSALLSAVSPAIAQVVGETHRTTVEPSAAVRDARHRAQLRITIW
jgi:hypothetical protein